MNNTGADIAISTLNKLTAQELAAASAASRDGNRPIYEISSTRYHAYLTAKDEIMKALADADQAEPASAKASGYQDRMRVEYRELTARAGRLRDMLQRYADGTLDFEPTCPISLLSRQLDVMDEYALILRRRANIEHIGLGEQRIDTATRDAR